MCKIVSAVQVALFLVFVLTLAAAGALATSVFSAALCLIILTLCSAGIARLEGKDGKMKDYRTRPQRPDPEQAINFFEMHDTHRVGTYRGWMIVQPYDELDGQILCFLPSIEWEDSSFPDLEYLRDYFTPEWEAGNLDEAIEFIDGYDND